MPAKKISLSLITARYLHKYNPNPYLELQTNLANKLLKNNQNTNPKNKEII